MPILRRRFRGGRECQVESRYRSVGVRGAEVGGSGICNGNRRGSGSPVTGWPPIAVVCQPRIRAGVTGFAPAALAVAPDTRGLGNLFTADMWPVCGWRAIWFA